MRLLFGARAYKDLKHFIPIFAGLQAAGCDVPGSIESLATVANAVLKSLSIVEADSYFKGADLKDRMGFFGSNLYKNFLECRAVALIDLSLIHI